MKSGYPVLTFTAGEGFPGLFVQGQESATLLLADNIPRGVFCEQSSQKTRELRREIMQSMIFVHCEACYCEGCER